MAGKYIANEKAEKVTTGDKYGLYYRQNDTWI